jgi:hypothetical protein
VSEKKIVQDEFDHSYCFQDDIVSAIGQVETNEPLLIKNTFDNLTAFHTIAVASLDELTHYICMSPEDVKNEDVLRWWYEHKHVFFHLS